MLSSHLTFTHKSEFTNSNFQFHVHTCILFHGFTHGKNPFHIFTTEKGLFMCSRKPLGGPFTRKLLAQTCPIKKLENRFGHIKYTKKHHTWFSLKFSQSKHFELALFNFHPQLFMRFSEIEKYKTGILGTSPGEWNWSQSYCV